MLWSHYRPSKRAVFWALFVVSALTVFLPPTVSTLPKHTATQLLAPLQDLTRFLTFQGRIPVDETTTQVDPMLERELASKALLNQQLRDDLERMGHLQSRSIQAAMQAHVVAWDIVSLRDSAVIERGSELNVSTRDWVASHVFLDRGGEAGVREGEAVIAREVLLGRIELVSPYMSRVRLFSDVDAEPIKVQFVGIRDGAAVPIPFPCTLRGQGRGRMIVRDVPYEFIDGAGKDDDGSPSIRVGDQVASDPGQLGLPVPMVIGRVIEIRNDPKQRLVYDVIIEPSVERDAIRYVHVIPLVPNQVAMD